EGLTRALAAELAPQIRVNAIAPSLSETPLAKPLIDDARMAAGIAQLRADRRAAGRRSLGLGAPPRWCAPRRRRWSRAAARSTARHVRAESRRPDRARGARAADGTPPSRAPPTLPSGCGGSGARL